ncbi:Hypothetical predicted protein [Octopus vulgaris]|uniref:Uncharacterized protein n=1 Tax=Octopus vulgaris TaxID=6645 RepID=A0AA36BF98_OCTVU|nr:Hypothetical predicted protein [Octopus vulgaris]
MKHNAFCQFPCFFFVLLAFYNCLGKMAISIEGMNLLKIVNKHNAFCIPKTEAITFPDDKTTLGSFGIGEEGCFHCMDCLWLKVMNPKLILGEETFKETSLTCLKQCQILP